MQYVNQRLKNRLTQISNEQVEQKNNAEKEQTSCSEECNFDIEKAVARYKKLKGEIDLAKQQFKKETEAASIELAEQEKRLREYAKLHGVSRIESEKTLVEIKNKTSRSIDPKDLYKFLENDGRGDEFFDFVSVRLKDTEDSFGRKVLEECGLIKASTSKFDGSIKVIDK